MGNIVELRNSLRKIDIWKELKSIVRENEDELLDLVTSQLEEGETKTGKTGTYSNMSADYVQAKLSQGRIKSSTLPYVNLYNEGDFYRQMTVNILNEAIEIYSKDSKAGELEDAYTSDIYIPNEKRMTEYIETILPLLQERIRLKLGL